MSSKRQHVVANKPTSKLRRTIPPDARKLICFDARVGFISAPKCALRSTDLGTLNARSKAQLSTRVEQTAASNATAVGDWAIGRTPSKCGGRFHLPNVRPAAGSTVPATRDFVFSRGGGTVCSGISTLGLVSQPQRGENEHGRQAKILPQHAIPPRFLADGPQASRPPHRLTTGGRQDQWTPAKLPHRASR